MARLADSYTATHDVVLVEPGVLRDVAESLSGLWAPEHERDDARRARLVAAARMRLYGSADRSGWALVTLADAHDKANERDADWSAGFVAPLERYDDAPPPGDVASLGAVLRDDEGLDGEVARTLALGLLCNQVSMIVARDPLAYEHQRDGDLPVRLRIVDPVDAIELLGLADGEPAWSPPPAGSMLAEGEPWWEPGRER